MQRHGHYEYLTNDAAALAFRSVTHLPGTDLQAICKMEWSGLHDERRKIADAMHTILDRVEADKRTLSENERLAQAYGNDILDSVNTEFERRKEANRKEPFEVDERGHLNPIPKETRTIPPDGIARRCSEIRGYKPSEHEEQLSPGDFFRCLASKDYGPLKSYRAEERGMVLGSGVAGGFAVPELVTVSVIDRLLQDQGIFSRVAKEFVTPGTGDKLNVVTFENSEIDSKGLYGFSKPTFVPESGAIPEGEARLVSTNWSLRKLAMGTRISLEALVAGDRLQEKLTEALAGALRWGVEYYVVRGSGVNEPLGLINSSCMWQYARATAGGISFADTVGVMAKTRLTNPVWIGSQSVLPALSTMTDSGGHAVFLGNGNFVGAAGPVPTGLLGYPINFNIGISPALGNMGDLMFCSDLQFYKIVLWQGLIVRASEGPFWSTGEIAIQVLMMMDAAALPKNLITVDGQTYGWGTVLK